MLLRTLLPGLLLGAPMSALAVREHRPAGPDVKLERLRERPFVLQQAVEITPDSDPSFGGFVAQAGGTWHARGDLRTGRLSLAWGSGIPWLPGRATELTWKGLGLGSEEASREAVLDFMEARARALMADHPGLFRVPPSVRLVRDPVRSGSLDSGRIWYLTLGVEKDGVPVEGAGLLFRVNSGNLVQLGSVHVGDGLEGAATRAAIQPEKALDLALLDLSSALGFPQEKTPRMTELVQAGTLVLLPWAEDPRSYEGPSGQGLEYRLAWRQTFRTEAGAETWLSYRDAGTGELLVLADDNRYACPPVTDPRGRVTGGVYLRPREEAPEAVRGMPYAPVTSGGDVTADDNGAYAYTPGQPASTDLSGSTIDVECVRCGDPPQAGVSNATGASLFLGTGGVDYTGNGFSTKAERNAFYHLNVSRSLASKHLTDAEAGGVFSRPLQARVNVETFPFCNSYFDGVAVNFRRSGAGCHNYAEIYDIVRHEWGHALDLATGGNTDLARAEGLGDVVAFLSTHDPLLGAYQIEGDPRGLRNADEEVAGRLSVTSHFRCWPTGFPPGPLGLEIYCEGQIMSQSFWHLGVNLRTKYGETAGWRATERLFFQSVPLSDTYLPDQARSTYDAVVLVDDDDGNLANGTPNGAEINEAFLHHEIASTPQVGDSAECTPPGTPTVTLAASRLPSTGQWEVLVSWPAVAGATRYEVVRNDSGSGADLPVGSVSAPTTQFVDADLTPGVLHAYRVTAFGGTGCASTGENQQQVQVPAVVELALAGFTIDDSAGNQNGVAEPGEPLRLPVVLRNDGGNATGVVGTLTTAHPGVTVTSGVVSFGNILPGGTRSSLPSTYGVQLDRNLVACGDRILCTLELEAAEGCAFVDFVIQAGQPIRRALVAEDFEADSGWTVNPAGTDTATGGVWVREDPNATGGRSQPEDDHTAAGTIAWVTGNSPANPADAAFDDVDGGCTTLQSPVYDLGGASGLELSYWRHFQIAGVLDDQFAVDISNDGGGSWLPVERLPEPVRPFGEARFDLDTLLGGPADRVVVRFTACDLGAASVLEALVDDLEISEPAFTCEPPEPRPRLTVAGWLVGDSGAFGGNGNGNGRAEAGERVRLPVDLANGANAVATVVSGVLSLVSGPAGTAVSDPTATWPDIAAGATQRTSGGPPAHFEIRIPETATCGDVILLELDATYDGPSGSYQATTTIALELGDVTLAPFYSDDFEGADNGWVHGLLQTEDDWHHDACLGFSPWDPDFAHSGTRLWGNDIGGLRNGTWYNGNYDHNVDNYLQSPRFDCRGRRGVTLGFWRWLTVESSDFDRARILVNGMEVWRNPNTGNLIDTAWTYQEIDISALADGLPDVRVRFQLTTDGSLYFGGWNLDDVQLLSRVADCEPFDGCGTPPLPGPTGPVLRETGRKDEAGAEFEWPGAPLGLDEFYRLYRGTTADAVTTPLTPDGFLGTIWDDRTAPGPLYFYRLVLVNCEGLDGPIFP